VPTGSNYSFCKASCVWTGPARRVAPLRRNCAGAEASLAAINATGGEGRLLTFDTADRVAYPLLSARRGGRIVTLSSVSGLIHNRGQVNYTAEMAGGSRPVVAGRGGKRRLPRLSRSTVHCKCRHVPHHYSRRGRQTIAARPSTTSWPSRVELKPNISCPTIFRRL
jgi:hypothetical protein